MASGKSVGIDVTVALGIASSLIGVCILMGDTAVGFGLALIIIPLLLYSAIRLPLRHSLMTLMFLVYVLPNPAEGITMTKDYTPAFATLGAVLLNHLNLFDRESSLLSACPFSGMDICLVSLGLIAWYRKTTNSTIDSDGRVPTPYPLLRLAWLSLLASGFTWLYGMVTGGNFGFSLWQLNAVLYCPLVFLLFHVGIRGSQDHRALAKVLLAAAVVKSFVAIWVYQYVRGEPDPYTGIAPRVVVATCHADSMLFADAFVLVVALLLEREKVKLWAAFLLPTLLAGMVTNNRRLVWVQVILVLAIVYIVSKNNPTKRFLQKWALRGSPLVLLYAVVGWNRNGSVFKPVRLIRSVVDAKSDGSSFWRELENFNLVMTMREHLVLGTGYGHPYQEYVIMPHVDYSLEHYVPHNSILGLWAFCGLVGYAGLTLFWSGGVYFAMRAYYAAKNGQDRAAALVSFGAVLAWLVMCFGDLGLNLWTGVFTAAPAFAISGKLAVSNGEWFGRHGARPTTGRTALS